jgi:hypothetical protein
LVCSREKEAQSDYGVRCSETTLTIHDDLLGANRGFGPQPRTSGTLPHAHLCDLLTTSEGIFGNKCRFECLSRSNTRNFTLLFAFSARRFT